VYEVWRRVKRTVLVPRGASIGVYRKGALAMVIGRAHMQPYELHILNTIRYLLPAVLIGPITLLGGLAGIGSNRDPLGTVLVIAVGAWVTAIGASIVWTRIIGKHFYLPIGRGREEVVFTKGDLARLLG
jgi:hypothetical protein